MRNKIISILLATLLTMNNFQVGTFEEKCGESPTSNLLDSGIVEIKTTQIYKSIDLEERALQPSQEEIVLDGEVIVEEQINDCEDAQEVLEVCEEPMYYEINVEVSYYCSCSYCSSGTGMMANGEYVYYGAIAVPYEFELGTIFEFEGQQWIACDRGGFIESYYDCELGTVYRVDVWLPFHEECLQRGRYITTAKVQY
jgi:hypothetical protein